MKRSKDMKSIINKKLEPTMCGMMTLVDTTEEEQEIIKKSITTIMLKNNLIHTEQPYFISGDILNGFADVIR